MGFHPEVSVLAAEKRYNWFMSILKSPKGGPLGIVKDLVVKKEFQERGTVHWHMLVQVQATLNGGWGSCTCASD